MGTNSTGKGGRGRPKRPEITGVENKSGARFQSEGGRKKGQTQRKPASRSSSSSSCQERKAVSENGVGRWRSQSALATGKAVTRSALEKNGKSQGD